MERNKATGISVFFVLLVLSMAIIGCSNNAEKINGDNKNIPASNTIFSGSLENGDAVVELTPKGFENGKFKVDVSLNTHSVDLSQFDLMKTTLLEYDGKKIKPESAPKLAGHHNYGTMIFNLDKSPESFKITITGIPNVEERVFEWP